MLHHTSYVCIPRMCVYALCIDDDDFSISDCRRSNGAWEQCTKCWKKDRNKKRGQMNKWEIYHQSGTLAVENILQENVCSRKLLENCFGRFYRWWDASYLENCKLNILRYDVWLFFYCPFFCVLMACVTCLTSVCSKAQKSIRIGNCGASSALGSWSFVVSLNNVTCTRCNGTL